MIEKLAQAGEGGGTRTSCFTISTITYKVVVASAEKADTLPLFLLYPYMYSVVSTNSARIYISLSYKIKHIKLLSHSKSFTYIK